MKFFNRLIITYISNLIALVAASYLVTEFDVTYVIKDLLWVVAIFTLINLFIRPVVKILLTPLIILSFGLFIIVINAGMLWLLDFLSVHITISGILPLIYATLIISFINIVINFSAKK